VTPAELDRIEAHTQTARLGMSPFEAQCALYDLVTEVRRLSREEGTLRLERDNFERLWRECGESREKMREALALIERQAEVERATNDVEAAPFYYQGVIQQMGERAGAALAPRARGR
jgi:hypothetical protein